MRRGFTIVELLVVIAIIGVLIGLLVPAVQMAREAARRTRCGNQMKQVSLALQSYHSSSSHLPAGVCNQNAEARVPPTLWDLRTPDTWFAEILPLIEQQSLYDAFEFSEGTGSPNNRSLVATRIDGMACPSDPLGTRAICDFRCNFFSGPTAASMLGLWYAASIGINPLWNGCAYCNPRFPTESNAWCCQGDDRAIGGEPTGMFSVSGKGVPFRSVTDGLSKTILLLETLPAENSHIGAYTGHFPLIAANTRMNVFVEPEDMPGTSTHKVNYSEAANIKSRHPGGAYFGFADGSVAYKAQTLDFRIQCAMGTRSGGETE